MKISQSQYLFSNLLGVLDGLAGLFAEQKSRHSAKPTGERRLERVGQRVRRRRTTTPQGPRLATLKASKKFIQLSLVYMICLIKVSFGIFL